MELFIITYSTVVLWENILDNQHKSTFTLQAEHQPGPQCKCGECMKLLRTENKWILRLGTFHGQSGLNTRDEVKSAVRGNYRKNRS